MDESTRLIFPVDSQGQPRIQPNSKGKKRRPASKSLDMVLKTSDEYFVQFIDRCLQWDPEKRMRPDEALKHPWIVRSFKKSSRHIP